MVKEENERGTTGRSGARLSVGKSGTRRQSGVDVVEGKT